MLLVLIIIAVVLGIILFTTVSKLEEAKKDLKTSSNRCCELSTKLSNAEDQNIRKEAQIKNLTTCINDKDKLLSILKNNNKDSIESIASLIADYTTLQYAISARYLEHKNHPAYKEAKRIRELKEQTNEIIYENKVMKYNYEYLFQLFPDLTNYIDRLGEIEDDLKEKESNNSNEESSFDRVRNYLSKEEYYNLPEDERNQLALDRYIEKQKSKWQIGRDYELSIGYEFTIKGWNIQYFGIEKNLEDLGRDLIATKGDSTNIIQCKYWSKHKQIHEKHICQLYGTTVQYRLSESENEEFLNGFEKNKILPVFVTNISLTKEAHDFANYLGVKVVENHPMKDFPRIKCNINKDEYGIETRIYHLPMDQQYDKAKICKPGEFFAFTVDEAVEAGFRRAWKWYGNI